LGEEKGINEKTKECCFGGGWCWGNFEMNWIEMIVMGLIG